MPSKIKVGHPSAVVGMSVAIVAGLAVGAVTAYGQGWLSSSAASLSNSAGPWSVAAFLVARYNRRVPTAVGAAILTLACCELGYALATEVRGGSNSSSTVVFWLAAALLAGPPLGIAGSWSTTHDLRRCVGFAAIGGVLVGEGLYGWLTLADTTDWRYWAVELVAGVVAIVAVAAVSSWPRYQLPTIAAGGLTAAVVFAAGRLA
jgi:hypothetical protein